ncbi:protein translocase subunit yidC [Terribacillus aidingensis]|uniref:Membrane protein insertase YidC n=1 Tax=Terribacillus aidingensis TaxID=586416 RepID=A0A285MYH8_9BACI|nr:YidC family membrane integrase SpoIIIJ [Terribacillus aidingensis]SNZ02234.1 protein translocase subunit yidC [Terribacillus aidingensis]
MVRKKGILALALVLLVAALAGCAPNSEPITSESTGFWNKYAIFPLSEVIRYFAELFSDNYGLGIIIVTVIIRLILLPLNIKQLKSSRSMQAIQPELKELQKKYSSKDANTQQKLQQETMQLFQRHGVNPLAGCLPIIVQMPILLAFYQAISRTEAIKEHGFLWVQLGQPDPYFILPIVAGLATFLQQKLMMAGNTAMAANPQMTMMLYIMPVMITVFALFLPSALALYWVVGNIFMVAQTLLINKPMMAGNKQQADGKK